MGIEKRSLGRTGEQVTVLGYGAMELRGEPRGPKIAPEDAGRVLNAVLDAGVNLIDTSIDYGTSEEYIGRYLAKRRDEYFLCSKCGCSLDPPPMPPYPHDFSAANVRAGVEQSLRRLQTDRLDLVQVHMSPPVDVLEREGTLSELEALKAEGKVRFIGMSGTIPNLSDHIDLEVFDVFQIPYSALQREHEQLITSAARSGAGTLIRGGAARGSIAEDKGWQVAPIGLREGEGQRRWEQSGVEELLDGMSRLEFVLRFTLSHPDLSSTIVGTSSLEHLASNLEIAARGPLPGDVYAEAKRRLGEVDGIVG